MENKGIQAQNLWDEKKEYFNKLIENLNAVDMAPVDDIIAILMTAKKAKKRLYFIGNGGSAGIAVHYAADYMKTGEFSTQTFYDPALMTCMGNDYGYEHIFSKPIEIVASAGDVLIAISSSGSSENILNGVLTAKEKGCKVITFSGFDSTNPLRKMGHANIYVPISEYGIVESIHNILLQQMIDIIKERCCYVI